MGGGKKESTPAQISPEDAARANVNAQVESIPRAAQLNWDVLTNPTYGAEATTALYENIRKTLYPEESNVRSQLVQNVLQSLISPQGITPQQQELQNQSRGTARNQLQEAIRNRQNLGGTLYGGRSGTQEMRAMGELEQGFAESDIQRDERSRLNAINSALPILQLLYPNVQITNPQYVNPVASADTTYGTLASQRNTDLQYTAQQQANQNALYSALFTGLGTAAGGWAGGAFGAGGTFGAKTPTAGG